MIDVPMKVREWRQKAANGTLTREEAREIVILLRADRKMSLEVQAIKKTRKVSNVDALLDSFANSMSQGDKP